MDEPCVIESFFGVYLLYSLNDKCLGSTYIGFTVDPNRRIGQHNKGKDFGGARKTNSKGPWKMILIVHGFPNSISALRFEWAWQHPERSRRLIHLVNKKKIPRKESCLTFNIRILSEMLQIGPWKRLPLTIRWIEPEYFIEFAIDKNPPLHMPICYGPIKSKKVIGDRAENGENADKCIDKNANNCSLCHKNIDDILKLTCLKNSCNLTSHVSCLADVFLTGDEFIPIEGDCPKCGSKLLWGDLIRKMKGCDYLKSNIDVLSNHDDSMYDCSSENSS